MQKMLSYDDVLLIPRYSNFNSRKETDISVKFCGKHYSAPIIMSPMNCVTSPQMIHFFIKENLIPTVHRYFKDALQQYDYVYIGLGEQILLDKYDVYPTDWVKRNQLRNNVVDFSRDVGERIREELDCVYFSVGSTIKYKQWIDCLLKKGIKKFCVDMAHGHSKPCVDTIKYIRSFGKDIKIIAGNIATNDAKKDLYKSGADALRVGIGGGSSCSTSANTGFGMSTLSSIQQICCEKNKVGIIADGGIRTTGDIVKSIYFGSDVVMLGKILAATDLSPSNCYNSNQQFIRKINAVYDIQDCKSNDNIQNIVKYKQYMGMASEKARKGVLQSGSIEGVSGLIKYTGKTKDIIENIKINMKSALSYGGCKNWKQLKQNVECKFLSNASILERKTHLDIER